MRLLICSLAVLSSAAFADVRIDARSAIVVDPGEPAALRRAVADLAADMTKVFGAPARVVSSRAEVKAPAVFVCLSGKQCGGARPSGTEVLEIRAIPEGVVLTGSDLRGAIYAVYEFSRRFLGVDPFYYWNDHEPARMSAAKIPSGTVIRTGRRDSVIAAGSSTTRICLPAGSRTAPQASRSKSGTRYSKRCCGSRAT